MKVYKATDKDMKCRGLQYEIGKTVEFDGKPELCKSGLHACEAPLDLLDYYAPGDGSRYFEAEADEVSEERGDDTKIVAKKLTLGAEIGIPGLVKAQIEWVKKQICFDEAIERAKNSKEHSATGYRGVSSATGDRGVSSATGDRGVSSATGYRGVSSATGDFGVSSATGYRGVSSATGVGGVSSATGDFGVSSATGKGGIAIASGYSGKARGSIGCAICICERGEWDGETYPLLAVKAAIIDGETLKPDTWYTLRGGEFVCADD